MIRKAPFCANPQRPAPFHIAGAVSGFSRRSLTLMRLSPALWAAQKRVRSVHNSRDVLFCTARSGRGQTGLICHTQCKQRGDPDSAASCSHAATEKLCQTELSSCKFGFCEGQVERCGLWSPASSFLKTNVSTQPLCVQEMTEKFWCEMGILYFFPLKITLSVKRNFFGHGGLGIGCSQGVSLTICSYICQIHSQTPAQSSCLGNCTID